MFLTDLAKLTMGGYMEAESVNCTFYWPEWHKFNDRGTLTVKVTGWDADCHWTGAIAIEPIEEIYPFWLWVI